jgi:hypothetical protein
MSLAKKAVRPWLAAVLWIVAVAQGEAAEAPANPAAWGVYAQVAGKAWKGEQGAVAWAWEADGTLKQSDAGSTSVIRLGEQPGQLVQESGALYTYDGYVAADGSVLWLRRGPFKTPLRVSLKDGRLLAESVKVDDDRQVVKVSRAWTYGPVAPAASAPVPAAPTAGPSAAPAAPTAPPASALAATAPPVPSTSTPPAPKSGPRTLSEADLARLRERMQGDKARRAQALAQERAAAEQLRQQMEQSQQMAAFEDEASEDEESSAPAPNLAEVFLTTLGNEMAKNQAEREAQDAFLQDLQRQQVAAAQRREREEQRRRAEAERARQPQYAQAPSPAAPVVPEAAEQVRQAQAAARERELATQAAAERQRLQQLRAQQAAAPATAPSGTAAGDASSPAAIKPLRFILTIGLLNKPGDTVNPTCYSNVITRPGPPGWGAPGFLPQGSGEQARAAVYALKDAFIARCRASGREITSDGNFNYVWNQTSSDEQTLQGVRPRFREDVSVSL